MLFASWLRTTPKISRPRAPFRPRLEALEGRDVPSTLTVTTLADATDPSDGVLSLREAIAAAQSGDTIVFAHAPTTTPTITLAGGRLLLTKNLTIQGPGADRLTLSGGTYARLFDVSPGATVTLSGMTMTKGYSHGLDGGGGILHNGTLTVSNSTLSDSFARWDYNARGGYGGGIYNTGAVTLSNSIISGNHASPFGGGGGIYNTAAGTVAVRNASRITGNTGGIEGGDPQDVYNLGLVYLETGSTIGVLTGNPAIPFDPDAPQLQIGNATVAEGNAGGAAAFTVTLSAPSTQTVTVTFAAAGSDYAAASGSLTFAPGETTKTVIVKGDSKKEANEFFYLDLFGLSGNAWFARNRGLGTILNDD